MKNYLVITLGTRDVQVLAPQLEANGFEQVTDADGRPSSIQPAGRADLRVPVRTSPDFPDYYTFQKPRQAGQLLDQHWDLFRPVLDFPLIQPVLSHLQQKCVCPDVIMLVYTDQEKAADQGHVEKRYADMDTVHFAHLTEKFIAENLFFASSQIDSFGCFEGVADMAAQYEAFAKIKNDLISDDEVRHVYLFPQGGIDQINQALTLRLIETFGGRVTYLQKAENAAVQELDFPARFVAMLNANLVRKHLKDYDFGYLDAGLLASNTARQLAKYAHKRLTMKHNDLDSHVKSLQNNQSVSEAVRNLVAESVDTDWHKLKDLYVSVKIAAHQKSYLEMLHKLYSLNENLFRLTLERVGGSTNGLYNGNIPNNGTNQRWVNYLTKAHPGLVSALTAAGLTNNPTRLAYQEACKVLKADTPDKALWERLIDKLETLREMRNDMAHSLGTTDGNHIEQKLGLDYGVAGLFADLDQLFNLTGFGIYDTLRREIESRL